MITINPGEIVRLPVLVCKGFVIFPEATSTIYAERNFSKTATKISLDKFEGYVVVVTQKVNQKSVIFHMKIFLQLEHFVESHLQVEILL